METNGNKGKRFLSLLRCSSKGQVDTSIDDQRRVINEFARIQQMESVGEVLLEGISGSIPGNRSDIEEIIQRKIDRDDFDVLVVHDFSRLTRSGAAHQHKTEAELNAAGIEVISCIDRIPEGDYADLMKTALATANKHHAKLISFNSTRGSQSSLEDGRSAYCRRPSFGIDRFYIDSDGTPRHIIRNLADGTQVMLSPDGSQELTRFGRNSKSGVPSHYIKQKQEKIVLIPGHINCVMLVRRIFNLRFVDGWGTHQIAKQLNCEGIPSVSGRQWSTSSIQYILDDPIYLGQGIANRHSSAIYHRRAPNCPKSSDLEAKELYNRKRPTRRSRPRSEWQIMEYPQLAEMLPLEIRDLVRTKQQQRLNHLIESSTAKTNRDRHHDSTFFLKGNLRSVQGNYPMTGRTTGKKGNRSRYYCVSRAFSCPDGQKNLRKLVPAGHIENAVLNAVKAYLSSMPDLRIQVEQQVRSELSHLEENRQHLDKLLANRKQLQQQIDFIIDDFDPDLREIAKQKLETLGAQFRSNNDQIARCQTTLPTDETAIQQHIDTVMDQVGKLSETLATAPPETLQTLLKQLISSLTVDLETRNVELRLGLPGQMCLVDGFPCKTSNEAQPFLTMPMGIFIMVWDRKTRTYHIFADDDPYLGGLAA